MILPHERTLSGPKIDRLNLMRALSAHAAKAVEEGYVKPAKRVFDNTKVSDHFAIIPTLQAPGSLSEIPRRAEASAQFARAPAAIRVESEPAAKPKKGK